MDKRGRETKGAIEFASNREDAEGQNTGRELGWMRRLDRWEKQERREERKGE